MNLRGRPAWWIFGVAAFAVGCGGDDESASIPGDDWGGQTGSLIPSCGDVPSLSQDLTVPSGDSPLVVQMEGCETALQPNDVLLLDELGQPVPFEFEVVGEVALIRTPEVLAPGAYSVRTPGLDEPLVVVDPEPLPSRLGTAEFLGENGCGAAFDLHLDPQALAYAPLLQLELSVDEGPAEVWIEYGQLEVSEGVARLNLQPCEPICFDDGAHHVEVKGRIIGETGELEPVSLDLSTSCAPEESSGGCAVTPPRRKRATTLGLFATLALAAFLLRSRRSSHR